MCQPPLSEIGLNESMSVVGGFPESVYRRLSFMIKYYFIGVKLTLQMSSNAYKNSIELKLVVDKHLLSILNDSNAMQSFHLLLDRILAETSIALEATTTKPTLAVYSEENGYQKVVFLFFYIKKLISLNYIQLIPTGAAASPITLGKSSNTQAGYLPKDVSDFICLNDRSNIVVSPEFNEFVKADHISLELFEARKSANASIIAAICAVISTCIALISLFCRLGS